MEKLKNGRKNMEKYKYWSELPATTHRFFLFMWHAFQHEMTIPKKFTKNFKEELSPWCTLIGPSKNKWKVKITRREDNTLVFTDGWEKFVRDHGIDHTDFLVFRYAGDSSFKVLVFDMSACEREGSHFAYNDDWSSSLSSSSSLEKASDISTRKKNVGTSTLPLNEGVFELDDASDDSWDEYKQEQGEDEDEDEIENEIEFLWQNSEINFNHNKVQPIEKVKKRERKKTSQGEGECEGEDLLQKSETKFNHNTFQPIAKVKKRGRKKTSEVKVSQVRYISKRRKLTLDEIRIASEKASDFMRSQQSAWKNKEQSNVPAFSLTMKPTNVYKGFQLTIPKEWALENLLREPHYVELRNPKLSDQSWIVGCRWTSARQCYLKAKWAAFVFDNNLEEHDACVFELIQQEKSNASSRPLFNVHIFRAIDDIQPVTVSRQMI